MRSLWLEEGYLPFRRKLLSGLYVSILILLMVFSWTVYKGIQEDREVATAQTQSLARAIESHASYTIGSIDLSLMSFANAARELSAHEALDLELVERLLSRSRNIGTNFWLLFIDAQGRAVAASNEMELHGRSFADQEFFKAHFSGDAGLFVGEPYMDNKTNRPQFVISRRVESITGEFLGVIAAPINTRHFAYLFENARYDESMSISLTHLKGKVIARSPNFEKTFALTVPRAINLRKAKSSSEGTYEAASFLDGTQRIFSFRTMHGLPLIVTVGLDKNAVAHSSEQILLVGGPGLLIIIAIMLLSCHYILASYRGLEEVVESRTQELKRANALLNQSQTALRNLAAHQNRLKEEERTNVAREVHDELGGCLTGIKAYISAVAANPADEVGKNMHLLREASKMADTAVDTVRRIITDLRPSVLDQLGIWAALEWGAEQFEHRTGIACQLDLDKVKDVAVETEIATMIFRIVQESLTNVVRHAEAKNVVIRGGWKEGRAVIEIEDDGIGIEAGELLDQESWGIMGMHERAQHAGAALKISGQPGRGTVVSLYLPKVTEHGTCGRSQDADEKHSRAA